MAEVTRLLVWCLESPRHQSSQRGRGEAVITVSDGVRAAVNVSVKYQDQGRSQESGLESVANQESVSESVARAESESESLAGSVGGRVEIGLGVSKSGSATRSMFGLNVGVSAGVRVGHGHSLRWS